MSNAKGRTVKIVIPMPPKSKGRPRFANGHAYTPKSTREYEEAVQSIVRAVMKSPLEGAIRIRLYFYLPVPKSWPKWKKQAAESGALNPTGRPDIDNLAKAILDALNGGIGYNDDSQLVQLTAWKRYGDPRTEIELEEI